MQLHTVQITNFRSIEDSGVVPIERVAALVGKNESGKTNFLQALVRLNPAPGQPDQFDINDDYPRRGLGDIEHRLKDPAFPRPQVISATYRLAEEEVAELERTFGEETLKLGDGNTIGIRVDYDRDRVWDLETDETAAVKHLATQAGVVGEPAKVKTLDELITWAKENATEDEESPAGAVLNLLEDWGSHDLDDAVIRWLEAREPLFIYFDEYAQMPGEGNVRELLAKREQGDALSPAERTFLALIDEARIDLEDLERQEYNALRNRLESASIRISEELYSYWSQNQTSGIDFDHHYEHTPDRHRPGHRGDLILKVRVEDKRHGVSVPIDRRSNGFVWFFSFLVNFGRIRDSYPDRPLVLLLDEPGTALHGLAQHDFLRVLDDRLAEHQILYTTHQPFLVDPDRLDRARPVVEDERGGSKVHAHAYKVDNDTLFPLQAALGYAIGQTLFVAPNVLLVEGTSDLIYLQLLSRACERAKKPGLDRRWTITPVGGIDRMDTFVRLFQGQQLNIAALVDVSGNRKTKVEKLVSDGQLTADQLVKIADFVDGDQADIEDIMSEDFYVQLVQGVGAEDPSRAIYGAVRVDQLPDKSDEPRITRRIDYVLEGFNQPRLDHLPPALYFERHQGQLLEQVDSETINRAAALFERLNSLLRA
jgi:hypothetical protein